jgi:hypothetical protein
MTIKELKDILCGLKQGEFAAINYGFYAELFPPGEPNESARTASYAFAMYHGCRIQNDAAQRIIRFVKSGSGSNKGSTLME